MNRQRLAFAAWTLVGVGLVVAPQSAAARDWYVSAKRGSGKQASKEQPATDLGNISAQLAAGDTVHLAAGTYLGKGSSGVDLITVPVQIIGGYADDFSSRDPWGAHQTILSGDNKTKNWKQGARLEFDLTKYRDEAVGPIVVDGLIVDQGAQNRFKDADQHVLVRKANPKTGENPTPDRGAIFIRVSRSPEPTTPWQITVRNNILLNAAPTQGALAVFAYESNKVEITNNVVINCTGTGIYAGTSWHGTDASKAPQFKIANNTVLFTWKYDAYVQSFSGINFATDANVVANLTNNILGFADRFTIQKAGKLPLLLKGNLMVGAVDADYYETAGDTKIPLGKMVDEAESLHPDSAGNGNTPFTMPISKAWLELYGQRVLIDRNAVEADIAPQRSRANAVRGMLGLPQQADDVKADSPVWLHRLALADAVKVAEKHLSGELGASRALIK